ncbi:MAG: aldo/keto reductase [Sedimentisphaeraceae bacterium JB056]
MRQTRQIEFGKRSGLKVYPVSMGAMRFPEPEQAIPLIRKAIDSGLVYIDTSRGYGESEVVLGKALKDGYREKVILSTKCSPWIKKVDADDEPTADCTYKRIIESMERLDVDYLDFYQVWNINSPEAYESVVRKGGMVDGIRRAIDEGLVGHTGFTTHDSPENVSRYIDEADWCEAILFTYNIMNPTYKEVIAKAHDKGIATIVMNPIGGGLFSEDSKLLSDAVNKAVGSDDVIEVAHRYLNSNPNVDTIICGINKPEDIESTIANYEKPLFTEKQMAAIEDQMKTISPEGQNFCTSCRYCMPCHQGINIPAMMDVVYYDKIIGASKKAAEAYGWQRNPNNKDRSELVSKCTGCGACVKKCTQNLDIPELLGYVSDKFEKED